MKNKYSEDVCKRYGIHISFHQSDVYYLKIEHDSDFDIVEGSIHPYIYLLSPADVEDLKGNFDMYFYILDNIIDKHLIKYIKNTRKKKIEALNEIQT